MSCIIDAIANCLLTSTLAGSSLSDAVIKPEDYTIHRQLSPRLSLFARLVTENVSILITKLATLLH